MIKEKKILSLKNQRKKSAQRKHLRLKNIDLQHF